MVQNILFRILVSPFALLYGIGVWIHHGFYRLGLLKSTSYSIPVIGIGNLTVGGAGKTPHVEFFLRWLQQHIEVSVLSRGYKRKTKGFREVFSGSQVEEVGDEPLQFKRKFPESGVFVSESRVLGIPHIIRQRLDTQLIVLDDAFQHRAVKPGLSLLLSEYDNLFTDDYLLPVGRLREWRSGYERADAIIISKCPHDLDHEARARIRSQIQPRPEQRLFFSHYRYGSMYQLLYPSVRINLHADMSVIVISGIARVGTLLAHVKEKAGYVKSIEYGDHHEFSKYEVAQLKEHYDRMEGTQKVIVTTEKDAVRLEKHRLYLQQNQLPVFVLPVSVTFGDDESTFKEYIQDFLLDFKV